MSNVLLKGGKVPREENAGTAMDRLRSRIKGGNAGNVDFRPMENDTQSLSGAPEAHTDGFMPNNLNSLSGAPEGIKHDWTVQELIDKMKENQKS